MSSAKVALAEHVLFEHFGAAVGIVAGILLARGRLSYETILRLLPRSTFTQATTQAALLVLIQHNCLYFVSEEDEGTEYYEIDLEAVLQRRRYGQFMAIAREHWGKRAVEVLQRVMLDGKIQLSTLLQDTSHLSDQRQTIRAIYELLDAGALQPVNRVDQTSQADQDLQQEKRLLRDVKGPPGPKDIKMMRIAVEERRAEMAAQEPQWGRNHETFVATCLSDEAGGGIDEEYGHHGNDNKKRRTTHQAGQSAVKAQRLDLPFDSNVYVRVRHEAFDVRIRNEIITRSVRSQKGPAAGVLVQTMLNESVKGERKLDNESSQMMHSSKLVKPANRRSPSRQTVPLPGVNGHSDVPVQEHAFYTVFPQDEVVATKGLESSGSWSAMEKSPLDLVNDVLHHLHSSNDARPKLGNLDGNELVKAKLDRAEPRQNSWLVSDYKDGKLNNLLARSHWAVDYLSAGEIIKIGLLESYINSQFGKHARRIWKALDEKGKIDEKQIAKLVMLPSKDVREMIATLSSAGFVLQQEVPRTVDRNPSRAFFLWYVSRQHCYQLMLGRLYEALVNIYVRREHERDDNKALLRRSERSDVRENIQLLDKADRTELETLEWRLESLGVAQERIDRDIFVLETLPAYAT